MTTTGWVELPPGVDLPKAAGDICLFKYTDGASDFTRRLARKYADRAAAELNLGRVGIRWYRYVGVVAAPPVPVQEVMIAHVDGEAPDADFCAKAEEAGEIIIGSTRIGENAIGILETLRGAALAAAIAHEVRHVAQFRKGMTDVAEMEADAETYSARYLARVRVAA